MDLDDVYSLNENYARHVSHIDMLLGAARVTDDPVNSAVGLGFEKGLVEQMMSEYANALIRDNQGTGPVLLGRKG